MAEQAMGEGVRRAAVARAGQAASDKMLERVFAAAFGGLVYPQIWEDPVVDMEALALAPGARVFAIASGGCNLMSYLAADPAAVTAVDLSPAHVALVRLKAAAAERLPSYALFFRFFGLAAHPENPKLYRELLWEHLDPETRGYWDRLDVRLRPRIDLFRRGLYRYGLLGRAIGLGHVYAGMKGVRLSRILEAGSLEEQRAIFDAEIGPLFDGAFIRWLWRQKASLFGLGIPPAQYEALAASSDGAGAASDADRMAAVLKARLRKLFCDTPIGENYFAWQAAARAYAPGDAGPLPPYLQSVNYAAVKARAGRIDIRLTSATDRLAAEPAESYDAYAFLDAQDWMTDDKLEALWQEVTRTARPGARVLFRTAAEDSVLPGHVSDAILGRWRYEAEASKDYTARDRSAIYGGVHLYVKER